MLSTYTYPRFEYRTPPQIASGQGLKVPVVVVGGRPVGLGLALDLDRQGVPVLLLDDDDTVSIGSRGVCYAKRALEILDRLRRRRCGLRQGRVVERRPHLLPREGGL
jgi:3-(3-hydroxy-phenyl)propionate hydroxylase